jgi:hypothetical protein
MDDNNYIIISVYAENKTCDKIQHLFMIITVSKLSVELQYFNTIKAIDDIPIVNIILNGEK